MGQELQTKEYMRKVYFEDKLTIPLLDKDNCLPKIEKPRDENYWAMYVKTYSDSNKDNIWDQCL
ncbi:hypothetical protein N3C_2036 [Clostridium sp. N3C]|nr:hypothetical protein N3C_2036 [Clostridium sp. N3C]